MAVQVGFKSVHNTWLFPLIASGSWFLTLSLLLGHWLAAGQPVYPGQSNPYVAYISDIAAFHFKPVFVIGSTVTAVTYFSTIFCVDYLRYASNHYAHVDVARWRKVLSSLAVLASLAAAISLLLLADFDTIRAHRRHAILLLSTFGGLGLSAISTSVVWSDQLGKRGDARLRKWCMTNTVLVAVTTVLSVMFVSFLYMAWMRTAGFLEWTITYLGAFWLFSFIGHLNTPFSTESDIRDEDRPLLSSDRRSERC